MRVNGRRGGRKRNPPQQKTRHHLVPRSRCSEQSSKMHGNIKMVPRVIHEAWHELFENMIPIEVIWYIAKYWSSELEIELYAEVCWEGREYKVSLGGLQEPSVKQRRRNELAWNRVFEKKNLYWAIVSIIEGWAPRDYFKHVILKVKDGRNCYEFTHHHEDDEN